MAGAGKSHGRLAAAQGAFSLEFAVAIRRLLIRINTAYFWPVPSDLTGTRKNPKLGPELIVRESDRQKRGYSLGHETFGKESD
jgi:hypothetical protein